MYGYETTIMDFSESQLSKDVEVAKRENLYIKTVQADMTKPFPFEYDSFDIIFCPVSNVYIENLDNMYSEAYRVLRKGELLMIGYMNPWIYMYDGDEVWDQTDKELSLKYSLVRLKAIYRLRFEHTTVMLCRVLHVNRSTYYNFINKRPSKREVENQRLRKLLLEIYMKAKKRIGTRAFKIILLRDYGVNISEGRILRLLKSMTLPKMSTIKPRFKSKKAPVFSSDNLLKQEFNPNSPNQVWTTDFTYISIGPKRHVYLCAILDLYSRKCIAWKVSDRIDAKLACDTLEIAINKRKPKEPIIFHSDQGSQFKSASFRKLLDEHQLLASYSKPGYPYDNAVTEVFFKYLKQREINRRTYHSIQEVQLSCFEYIEQFYNNYNPHSANNGLTPNQKEENYFKKI